MKRALMPSLRMADKAALNFGNTAVAAITSSADFPNISPSVAIVQGALDTYTTTLAAAQFGGREQKAQKDTAKQNMLTMLRQWCDYINTLAQGNINMLATCGYLLSKDRQPTTLGTPKLEVQNGASGQLVASSPAVEGAVAYRIRYSAEPSSAAWSEILSTRSTIKIDGLQPGQLYSVGMTAIGTNDQVTMSAVVTKMVA